MPFDILQWCSNTREQQWSAYYGECLSLAADCFWKINVLRSCSFPLCLKWSLTESIVSITSLCGLAFHAVWVYKYPRSLDRESWLSRGGWTWCLTIDAWISDSSANAQCKYNTLVNCPCTRGKTYNNYGSLLHVKTDFCCSVIDGKLQLKHVAATNSKVTSRRLNSLRM